jgi:hypothetical protein
MRENWYFVLFLAYYALAFEYAIHGILKNHGLYPINDWQFHFFALGKAMNSGKLNHYGIFFFQTAFQ